MARILLVCSAGMSTSFLVKKMEEAARDKNKDIEIFAVSSTEAEEIMVEKEIDILLLGPQLRFMKDRYEEIVKDKNIPVKVIDNKDYGMMNGKKILEEALEIIENK